MKNIKSIRFLSSILGVSAIVSIPTVITSCSNFSIPEGEIGRNDQLEMLSSDESKQAVMDAWLTKTFSSLYASTILNDASKITDLEYYLNNLTWDTNSTLGSTAKTNFETLIYDTFKFYVTFKSTVSSSTSDTSPSRYFFDKAIEWQSANYTSTDGSVSIANFNPGFNYLPPSSPNSDTSFKKDFEILMKVRMTAVYADVLKMLIGQMYFLHAQKSQILNGTNYQTLTKKPSSVDYINATAFDINNPLYFLMKYLVETAPRFEWAYASTDYTVSSVETPQISTYKEFNNINPTIVKNIYNTIAPVSPDTLADNILNASMLNGFSGLVLNSENTDGDLTTDIEQIKTFNDYKVGLLETSTNTLVSFTEMQAAKQLFDLKSKGQNVGVPSINVKTASQGKITSQLTLEDFEMAYDNQKGTFDSASNTLSLSLNDALKQKWTITKISYVNQEESEHTIHLSVKYEFTNQNQKYEINYEFDIQDWNKGIDQSINPFKEAYKFTIDNSTAMSLFPTSVKIIDDSASPLGVTYVMRILPKFKQTGQILIDNNWYMTGQFTMEDTIWNNSSALTTLANLFVLSDSSLWTTIQDYYLFNNYNIESNQSEIISIISTLGLTKKTNTDRDSAGIPRV